jgi:hypothetical protein
MTDKSYNKLSKQYKNTFCALKQIILDTQAYNDTIKLNSGSTFKELF